MKIILILILNLVACSSYEVIRKTGNNLDSVEATQYQNKINGNFDFRNYRSLSKIKATKFGKSFTSRQITQYQTPDQLRIDLMPLNSAYLLSSLIVNASEALVLIHDQKQATIGASQELFFKETQIPVNPVDFAELILGYVKNLNRFKWSINKNDQILLLENDSEYLELDLINLKPKAYQLYKQGDFILEIKFLEYQKISEQILPKKLEVYIAESDLLMEILITQIELNVKFNRNPFDLTIPDNFSVSW